MNIFRFIIAAGLVGATATTAAAQPSTTPTPSNRWTPWLGCWQIAEESVQDPTALLSELAGASAPASITRNALVCVTPSSDGGATMTTYVNDEPVLVEAVVADGTRRPLSDANCRGWQRAEWSALGARLYADAEVTCGDKPARNVSGLATIITGPRWLDIQVVESEGQKSMRVRRYRRAANQKHAAPVASTARELPASAIKSALSIADIQEAAAKVPTEALQAAVLELGEGGYDLNASRLRELAAARVPKSVIDLMVALSFPERFVVERRAAIGGFGGGFGGYGGYGGYGGGFEPLWGPLSMWPAYYADPFFYSSLYSPFGYRSWGYYDPYYYRGPGVIIIDPGDGGMPAASGDGRVVDGRGYTRIRRNEPDPAIRVSNADGNGGRGSSSTGSGNSGSSAGTSGVSSGGYSSGGASGGGGRTAVPRPPG
jgi:hypothetical protein